MSTATQPKIETLDPAPILEAARRPVEEQLAAIDGDWERLDASVALLAELDPKILELREQRDALMLSAAFYDGVRAVNRAAGISRTMLSKIKRDAIGPIPTLEGTASVPDQKKILRLARKAKIKRRKDALEVLPTVARELTALEGQYAAARDVRNALVVKLVESKQITATEIAKRIGTGQARVSRLLAEHRD